jgi:hypothetical protein
MQSQAIKLFAALKIDDHEYRFDPEDLDMVERFNWWVTRHRGITELVLTRVEHQGESRLLYLINLISGLLFNKSREYRARLKSPVSRDYRKDNISFMHYPNQGDPLGVEVYSLDWRQFRNQKFYQIVASLKPLGRDDDVAPAPAAAATFKTETSEPEFNSPGASGTEASTIARLPAIIAAIKKDKGRYLRGITRLSNGRWKAQSSDLANGNPYLGFYADKFLAYVAFDFYLVNQRLDKKLNYPEFKDVYQYIGARVEFNNGKPIARTISAMVDLFSRLATGSAEPWLKPAEKKLPIFELCQASLPLIISPLKPGRLRLAALLKGNYFQLELALDDLQRLTLADLLNQIEIAASQLETGN